MGTEFRILFYTDDSTLAALAARHAFERIAALDSMMSDYREDSEISLLAKTAGQAKTFVPVSDDLRKVLNFAQEVSKRTGGAFDVTAGSLTKLWRRAFRQKEMPSSEEIAASLKTVGYRDLTVNKNKTVQLKKPGMMLDLGGIAKGYAVDEAMSVLQSHGILIALVDGGGDLRAAEAPPGTIGWLIEKPVMTSEGLGTKKTTIRNAAVATSGATYKFLEHEGKRYSHIIDPRTGKGVTERHLVTVTAPTCMEADAWATALSVEVGTDVVLWLNKKGVQVEFTIEH